MRTRTAVFVLAALSCTCVMAEKASYDGYRVYRVNPATQEHLDSLRHLQQTSQFDIWNHVRRVNVPVDVLVPPHKRAMFAEFLHNNEMDGHVMIQDVQQLMETESGRSTEQAEPQPRGKLEWTAYYPLEDLFDWLDDVVANNSNINIIQAGNSYENRAIRGIEIINGPNLPGVVLESGIHAREWIGPAVTTWIVDKIIKSDADSVWRKFNYVYFPSVNPDGYAYTWSTDRMWRKTRKPYANGCVGADPNRNYDYHWLDGGSSTNPCSESYAGPSAFSEVETRSFSDYLSRIQGTHPIHLAFHSYSQLLMFPWGYTATHTPMHATWQRIGDLAAASLKAVHGTEFEVGDIYETIYQTSGTSTEWYYGAFNATIAYTFELRDTGRYGFILPPDQIIPTAEEMIAAVQTILQEYLKL